MGSPFRISKHPRYDSLIINGTIMAGMACGVEFSLSAVDHEFNTLQTLSIPQPDLLPCSLKSYIDDYCEDAESKFASMINLIVHRIEYRSKPHQERDGKEYGIYREIIAVELEKDGYVLRIEPNNRPPFNSVKWTERKLTESEY